MKRFIFRTVVISITVSALVLVLNSLGVFQRLENILYDSRMVHTASYNRPSDEIAVILVDQDSIDWANQELVGVGPGKERHMVKLWIFLI